MKITTQEINQNNVKSAPDKLSVEEGYSISSIKHIFDKLPELIAEKHNKLLEFIQEKGGPVKSEDITDIRMNRDNALEVTSDGENWQLAGNVGHVIADGLNDVAPQRSRLKFAHSIVSDNGDETVVEDMETTVYVGDYGGYSNGSYVIPTFNVNRCGRLTYASESVISTATSGSNGLMSSSMYNYISTNGHCATKVIYSEFLPVAGGSVSAVVTSTDIGAEYKYMNDGAAFYIPRIYGVWFYGKLSANGVKGLTKLNDSQYSVSTSNSKYLTTTITVRDANLANYNEGEIVSIVVFYETTPMHGSM